jgi:YD repeat-containing protein
LTDDTKHREEVFNFLAKINPIDSFEFEILEIPKSLTMWNHLIILFNVNSDNKVYHFIIVPPSSLSFHGTLIENLDDNRILKQTFMISGGQQIITNTEQYNTEGHILFEENQSGKRVNYFYSDGGQLVGETTLKRCRLNDNFSSKKKDLKKNYCINKNEINVVNPPFTQIQQYYKNMNMKGWSYTFNK